MDSAKSNSRGITARTRHNTVRLAWWTAAWVITLAIAVFGPQFIWESKGISLAAILLNVAVGIGMIVANKRHLDGLDELQRKIQLEAMGLALGVALVAGLAYSTLDISNVISGDAEISFLVMLIGLTYLISVLIGHRKYK
jgi:signal transduction histidine kinase